MALPTTPYLARASEPMLPQITSPVCTATPISTSGSPSARLRSRTTCIACCIATAHATARSASSPRATGAPNSARMLSPTNSSIVPLCARITSVIALK